MSSTHRVRTRTRPQQVAAPASAVTPDRSPGQSPQADVVFDPAEMRNAPYVQPGEELSQNIAVRARQVGRLNPEYSEEFILQALNQMLLARVPKDQIAQRFGVTVRTVYNWEQKLRERLREEAKNIDPMSFLGESLEFYKQLRAAGMAMFLTGGTLREKQIGMEQARSSHNDMHKFLHISGFYDTVKFQPANVSRNDEHIRLADEVSRGARDILAAFEVLDADFEDTEPPQTGEAGS